MRKLFVLALILLPAFATAQSLLWKSPEFYRFVETPSGDLYTIMYATGNVQQSVLSRVNQVDGTPQWQASIPRGWNYVWLFPNPLGVTVSILGNDSLYLSSFSSSGQLTWTCNIPNGTQAISDQNGTIYVLSTNAIHKVSSAGTLLWTSTVPGIENTFGAQVIDQAGNYWGFETQDADVHGKTYRSITAHKVDATTGKELVRKVMYNGVLSSEKSKGSTSEVSAHSIDALFAPVAIAGKVVYFASTDDWVEKTSPTFHKIESAQAFRAYVVNPDGKFKMAEFTSKAYAYVSSSTEKGKHSYAEGNEISTVLQDRYIYLTAGQGKSKATASSFNTPEFRTGGSSEEGLLIRFDVSNGKFITVKSYANRGPQIWAKFIGEGRFVVEDRALTEPYSSWNIIDLTGKQIASIPSFAGGMLPPFLGTYDSHSLFSDVSTTTYPRLIKYDFSSIVPKSANQDLSASNAAPSEFRIDQNYPNPFNPSTQIHFARPVESQVHLMIFNTLGQQVAELVNGIQSAGEHSLTWDAANFSSGVYFYQIEAVGTTDPSRTFRSVGKMVLAK